MMFWNLEDATFRKFARLTLFSRISAKIKIYFSEINID